MDQMQLHGGGFPVYLMFAGEMKMILLEFVGFAVNCDCTSPIVIKINIARTTTSYIASLNVNRRLSVTGFASFEFGI